MLVKLFKIFIYTYMYIYTHICISKCIIIAIKTDLESNQNEPSRYGDAHSDITAVYMSVCS